MLLSLVCNWKLNQGYLAVTEYYSQYHSIWIFAIAPKDFEWLSVIIIAYTHVISFIFPTLFLVIFNAMSLTTLFSFIFAGLKFHENYLGTFCESFSRSRRKIVFAGNLISRNWRLSDFFFPFLQKLYVNQQLKQNQYAVWKFPVLRWYVRWAIQQGIGQ